jgi:hypothetical protein
MNDLRLLGGGGGGRYCFSHPLPCLFFFLPAFKQISLPRGWGLIGACMVPGTDAMGGTLWKTYGGLLLPDSLAIWDKKAQIDLYSLDFRQLKFFLLFQPCSHCPDIRLVLVICPDSTL